MMPQFCGMLVLSRVSDTGPRADAANGAAQKQRNPGTRHLQGALVVWPSAVDAQVAEDCRCTGPDYETCVLIAELISPHLRLNDLQVR